MGSVKMIIAFLVMSAIIVGGAANADDFDRYRVPCQPQQLPVVQNAVAKARDLLAKANVSLPPNNSATGSKFQKWFGGKEGEYDPTVKAVYAEALGFLAFKTLWCPNASFPDDDPGTFAFVPEGAGPFGEVFVEAAFFKASTKGADSQSGTIIHEVVHLSTQHSIVDVKYGTSDAKSLAKTDPQKARSNADSYQYFIEDLVDGIP